MLSIEESKRYLGGLQLSDAEIVQLRDALYAIANELLDDYLQLNEYREDE